MKSFFHSALGLFTSLVEAINMTFYNPQYGVDYAFSPVYEALLAANEDPV
ncbi:hypothetical protein DL95DRAFT_466741 [Leptodontidium sp. 2 PMI_412]|nr:hypothetical protein DL95DRAFT_466741 [Leptodontidium sp. 2 PMI_412]